MSSICVDFIELDDYEELAAISAIYERHWENVCKSEYFDLIL